MIVTDICRDENGYNDGQWTVTPADVASEIEKYNNNPRRFLFYPWGIFVTAYARMRLFRAIWAVGEHGYYYSDTDSCKIIDGDIYKPWFVEENERVTERLNKALRYHRIDPARGCPKTIKGVAKPLGVWDYEERYTRFKALRAKAYMIEDENGTPFPSEARMVLLCRQLYAGRLQKEHFLDPSLISAHYPAKDYHQRDVCEIEHVLLKED